MYLVFEYSRYLLSDLPSRRPTLRDTYFTYFPERWLLLVVSDTVHT